MAERALSAVIAGALAGALLVSGCRKPSSTPTRERPASSAEVDAPSLLTAGPLQRGLVALHKKLGKPIKALELLVYPDHLVLQVQNPEQPTQVLQYEYRDGKISKGIPVELQGSGKLSDNLFTLDDIHLDAVPQLARQAVQKVDPKNGRVSYIILKRNLPFEMDVQYRVFVKSPLRDGYVDADKNGKLIEDNRAE